MGSPVKLVLAVASFLQEEEELFVGCSTWLPQVDELRRQQVVGAVDQGLRCHARNPCAAMLWEQARRWRLWGWLLPPQTVVLEARCCGLFHSRHLLAAVAASGTRFLKADRPARLPELVAQWCSPCRWEHLPAVVAVSGTRYRKLCCPLRLPMVLVSEAQHSCLPLPCAYAAQRSVHVLTLGHSLRNSCLQSVKLGLRVSIEQHSFIARSAIPHTPQARTVVSIPPSRSPATGCCW